MLAVEIAAINRRRSRQREDGERRRKVGPLAYEARERKDFDHRRLPDADSIFGEGPPIADRLDRERADPRRPDSAKMHPQPIPCTAAGLALSGGGIRSAAICLGALQGLSANDRLEGIDYLSTVSGGGYIGSSLSAASRDAGPGYFPFGTDYTDGPAVAHLRNYSNYLMPRGRSALRNGAEAAVILLRGLVANAIVLGSLLLIASIITWAAYRTAPGLEGSFIVRLLLAFYPANTDALPSWLFHPFLATGILAGLLATGLTGWAVLRSLPGAGVGFGDTRGPILRTMRWLLILTAISTLLDLQPLAIGGFRRFWDGGSLHILADRLTALGAALGAFAGAVAAFAANLGQFLEKSRRSSRWTTMAARLLAQAAILLAASILPLLLWAAYLTLAGSALDGYTLDDTGRFLVRPIAWLWATPSPSIAHLQIELAIIGSLIGLSFGANGYTLHRFYRDRLSKAFLFAPLAAAKDDDLRPLDDVKLSSFQHNSGPYHLINAALNLQASAEANRRGRNADFFLFTPDFVGSDLTMYTRTGEPRDPTRAATVDMERIDPALDLATAMAISGAAVSANMGSNTIRALSPTLAALNIRLGYWLRNPRYLAGAQSWKLNLRAIFSRFLAKFFLAAEMLNLHDETSPVLFLTDGGHIENLGIYELLKRGCRTIVAIDAEADPEMSFSSLLKLERHARIDLGVRITLPWEEIAHFHHMMAQDPAPWRGRRGPHCAVGRIDYADGARGVLLYFKSSLTGDEKDYILDYRRRHPAFPHETTGDQFFTEEQFEMYRALGFHMVDGFLRRRDRFTYLEDSYADANAAFADVMAGLPIIFGDAGPYQRSSSS